MATDERKIILEIDLDVAKSAKSIGELKELQKSLNTELQKAQIGTDAYKKFELQSALVGKELKKLSTDTSNVSKELGVQSGSLRDIQNEYNKYATALRETAPGNKVLGLSFEEAQKKAAGLKTEIKDFEAKLGNFQPNVGNYAASLKDAAAQSGVLGQYTGQLSQINNTLKSAFGNASTGATSLRSAMLAIPIVAIIAAVAALIKIFQQNDDANDKLVATLGGVKAAFGVVVSAAIPLVDVLKGLFNIALAGAKLLTGDFNGALESAKDAIDNAKDAGNGFAESFDNIGGKIKGAYDELYAYNMQLRVLEDNEDAAIATTAEAQKQIAQLLIQAKNRQTAEKDRLKLLDQASSLEKNNAVVELANAKERLKLEEDRFNNERKRNGFVAEEGERLKEIYQLRANVSGLEKDSLVLQETIENRRDALLQAQHDKELKRIADRQKAEKEAGQDTFDLFKAQNDAEIAELSRRLKTEQLGYEQRIEIIQKVADDQRAIEIKNSELLLSNAELTEKQREVIKIQSDQKIRAIDAAYVDSKKQLDTVQLAEQQRFEDAAIALDISRTNRIIENNKRIIEDKKTTDELRFVLIDENAELEIEKETYRVDALLANENLLQSERLRLQEEYKATTTKITQDAEKAKQEALLKTKQINDSVEIAKLNAVKATLGSAAALFDQQSTGYKALASAQAVINTYQAATAALASGSEINPVFGIVSAGVAIANGLASVAKINGVQFEQGGIANTKQGVIGGNLHSNGGTKFYGSDGSVFEAERGELLTVVNRWDTKRLSALSNANSVHGKPFFQYGGIAGKAYLQDGGIALRQAGQPAVDSVSQMNDIIKIVSSIPAPVVGVKDILTGADKRSRVRVMANLTKGK